MSIKSSYYAGKQRRADHRVNSAVKTLGIDYGLGYSRTEGIIGNTRNFSKKDMKKI